MTLDDQPRLSLGEPPKGLKRRTQRSFAAVWVILILLQTATLVCLLLFTIPKTPALKPSTAPAGDLKTTAMTLEEKSLYRPAAEAWTRFLEASPETAERAQIYYRVGKLYYQCGAFEEAAAAFVQAEIASGEDPDLLAKTGPKMVDCLRKLGHYGEVGRELSRRVEAGKEDEGKGPVLATFAGESLTEADLDRMIESRVDQMLALNGSAAGEESRQALLKEFKDPRQREQIFHEILQSELFSRRARELGLDQTEGFQKSLEFLETSLLAGTFLRQNLEKISPTDVDLESYFKAHAENYREPEKVQVVALPLGPEEDLERVLKAIDSSEAFLERAGAEAVPFEVKKGAYDARLGKDTDALFDLEPGAWTRSPIENQGTRYLCLVKSRTASRLPALAEVREQVLRDYTNVKQQEAGQKLLQDLMTRYDVKILHDPKQEESQG